MLKKPHRAIVPLFWIAFVALATFLNWNAPVFTDYLLPWIERAIKAWDADDVTAFATIAAVVVALWVALRGEKQRRQEGTDRAIIAAAVIHRKVSVATMTVERITRFDNSEEFHTVPNYKVADRLRELAGIKYWKDDEVLPLVVLPHRIAARLITLREALEALAGEYENYAKDVDIWIAQREVFGGIIRSDFMHIVRELRWIDKELFTLTGELHGPLNNNKA